MAGQPQRKPNPDETRTDPLLEEEEIEHEDDDEVDEGDDEEDDVE